MPVVLPVLRRKVKVLMRARNTPLTSLALYPTSHLSPLTPAIQSSAALCSRHVYLRDFHLPFPLLASLFPQTSWWFTLLPPSSICLNVISQGRVEFFLTILFKTKISSYYISLSPALSFCKVASIF